MALVIPVLGTESYGEVFFSFLGAGDKGFFDGVEFTFAAFFRPEELKVIDDRVAVAVIDFGRGYTGNRSAAFHLYSSFYLHSSPFIEVLFSLPTCPARHKDHYGGYVHRSDAQLSPYLTFDFSIGSIGLVTQNIAGF